MRERMGSIQLGLLLRATVWMVSRAQSRNERVKQMLDSYPCILQTQTDAGAAWYFQIANGQLTLHSGKHPNPDLTQIWGSAADAARILPDPDPSAMVRAFEKGLCRMSGSFLVGIRFNELTKLAHTRKD